MLRNIWGGESKAAILSCENYLRSLKASVSETARNKCGGFSKANEIETEKAVSRAAAK